MTESQKNSFKYFSPLNDRNIDWDRCEYNTLKALDQAREYAGIPIYVTSNHRTPEESVNAGGFETDEHTETPTKCFDIRCRKSDGTWDSSKAFKLITALLKAEFTRIGVNKSNKSIHAGMSENFPQQVFFIE